jgi:hypothetical protein
MEEAVGIPVAVVIDNPGYLCVSAIKVNLHTFLTSVSEVNCKFCAPTGFVPG